MQKGILLISLLWLCMKECVQVKPYKCSLCEMTFKIKSVLQTHIVHIAKRQCIQKSSKKGSRSRSDPFSHLGSRSRSDPGSQERILIPDPILLPYRVGCILVLLRQTPHVNLSNILFANTSLHWQKWLKKHTFFYQNCLFCRHSWLWFEYQRQFIGSGSG